MSKDHSDSSSYGVAINGADCVDEAPSIDVGNVSKGLLCGKEKVGSLIWAWNGSFEKALGDLDRALRSFLVGLEKIGPRLRFAGRKKEIGFRAYRHPPKPKPKLKSNSKGPLLSRSKIKASFNLVPGMLVALPVAM